MKKIRVNFSPQLVPLVLSGKKNLTWRINDEKDFQPGDELILWEKGKDNNGKQVESTEPFGKGLVIEVWEKPFREFKSKEKEGHEKFENNQKMLEQYQRYYGSQISFDTVVKIVKFKLIT